MGRRSKYPEAFRQRAAQLVLDSRRSVREVADESGVHHETLRNGVAGDCRQRADGPAALSADERMELARLWCKVAELGLERDLEEGRSLLRSGDGPVSRGLVCMLITAEKTSYGVRRLC